MMKNLTCKLFTVVMCAVFVAFLLTGCGSEHIRGNDNIIEANIPITGQIEGIYNMSGFNVVLTGKQDYISLHADKNLVPYILIEQFGYDLHILALDNRNLRPTSPIEIKVPVTYISIVTLRGSGNITNETALDTDRFTVMLQGSGNIDLELGGVTNLTAFVQGSGDINLTGQVVDLDVSMQGSGNINAQNIQADNAIATMQGTGRIRITATYILAATLVRGNGNIYHYGNPMDLTTDVMEEATGRIRAR